MMDSGAKHFITDSKDAFSGDLGTYLRKRFPFFQRAENQGKAFLDTAASALKLGSCIERLTTYLSFEHANIHRGAYSLSMEATRLYEEAREGVRSFIDVPDSHSIIFTAGATDSLNLLATGFEGGIVRSGQGILTTLLEHHSNFVPWQQLARRIGGNFYAAKITPSAEMDILDFLALLTEERPKVAAFTAQSNAFGTIPPVGELLSECRRRGVVTILDISQSVVHGRTSIAQLDPDFAVFSAHKLYGPTGLGVLIGRTALLEQVRPARFGGGMVEEVGLHQSTFAEIPRRFEAGTPPIAEAIAFHATLRELEEIRTGYDIAGEEELLFHHAREQLLSLPGVEVVGPEWRGRSPLRDQASILSFTVQGVHPHDVATICDSYGVQVRAGHHCVMPAMRALGLPATTRVSLGLYSTHGDIEKLVEALRHAQRIFS